MIGAYHQLFQIEKSFRMAKSDLQARPVYHRKRDSIEAHLTIVLRRAGGQPLDREHQTGWSIRNSSRTARRYRTIQIQAGDHVITAADPLPDDLRHALEAINSSRRRAHYYESSRSRDGRLNGDLVAERLERVCLTNGVSGGSFSRSRRTGTGRRR